MNDDDLDYIDDDCKSIPLKTVGNLTCTAREKFAELKRKAAIYDELLEACKNIVHNLSESVESYELAELEAVIAKAEETP